MEEAIGWRIWHLWPDGSLRSLAFTTNSWVPGENKAVCHRPQNVILILGDYSYNFPAFCEKSPGSDCDCGLWAVWNPYDCIARTATAHLTATASVGAVMGLVRGWGTIALHGDEGFRAEYASIVCLFSDSPLELFLTTSGILFPAREAQRLPEGVSRAAQTYGVPSLSLSEALEIGFFSELGLDAPRIAQVRSLAYTKKKEL